jgi:MFS family permease
MGIIFFSAIRSLVEGIIADRLGRKPVLLFIAASLVVGGDIFIATTNIMILLIAAILFTVGGSITYTPAEITLLGDKVSDGNRTIAYSINATFATAASILGSFAGYGVVQVVSRFTSAGAPAITGYLYEFVSLSFPFYGAGFFQFASATSMYLFFKDVKPPEERAGSGERPGG